MCVKVIPVLSDRDLQLKSWCKVEPGTAPGPENAAPAAPCCYTGKTGAEKPAPKRQMSMLNVRKRIRVCYVLSLPKVSIQMKVSTGRFIRCKFACTIKHARIFNFNIIRTLSLILYSVVDKETISKCKCE